MAGQNNGQLKLISGVYYPQARLNTRPNYFQGGLFPRAGYGKNQFIPKARLNLAHIVFLCVDFR